MNVNYCPPTMGSRCNRLARFIGILLLGSSSLAAAAEIRVAVAANFAVTLTEIAALFAENSGHKVILTSGSTGKHYAQIVNGAPFDIFFAADAERPRLLAESGIGIGDSRYSYAAGRMVLWSPAPGFVDATGQVLMTGTFRFLAIANPLLAPYGEAAREVLQQLGRWDALQSHIVRGENINQVYQFVHSGNAELGFIARSQISGSNAPATGSYWEVPAAMHTPIRQQAMLLKDTVAGRAFMEFVRTETARQIIRSHGYDLPD